MCLYGVHGYLGDSWLRRQWVQKGQSCVCMVCTGTWVSTGCADSGWLPPSGHRARSVWCSSPSRGSSHRCRSYCSTWPPLQRGWQRYQHTDLSLCLCLYASLCLSICLSLSVSLSVCLSICLSVRLSLCPPPPPPPLSIPPHVFFFFFFKLYP